MDDIAIKVDRVNKTFKLPHEKTSSVKGALIGLVRGGKKTYEEQRVLKDVSFEIKKGEFFGIVGRNGSGKSTLLKMLAGIYSPTGGGIQVNGKLTPFIELGVGFNPELTGRENVYLNGALLGFNRKEMNAKYDEIVKFAELEQFMDQKLKNYSSGMQVRLAFSIAIRAQTDILVLDEVLAVGDAIFQKKCFDYFKTLKKNKQTVVFVSHDIGALQEYCDKGILIEAGKIVHEGSIGKVVNTYIDILNKTEEKSNTSHKIGKRWGRGDVTIGNSTLSDSKGKKTELFTDKDATINYEVSFKANKNLETPVYGITITDITGQVIFQSNTLWCGVKTEDATEGQIITAKWEIPNVFNTGSFFISPACSDASGVTVYQWLEEAAKLKIRKKQKSHGYLNAEHKLVIKNE